MPLSTNLAKHLTFPCDFTYKVIAVSAPSILNDIKRLVEASVWEAKIVGVRSSSKKNFYAISIEVRIANQEQLESVYKQLASLANVKYVL